MKVALTRSLRRIVNGAAGGFLLKLELEITDLRGARVVCVGDAKGVVTLTVEAADGVPGRVVLKKVEVPD